MEKVRVHICNILLSVIQRFPLGLRALQSPTFLSLSEQGKEEYDGLYQVRDCDLLKELHQLWGIELDFKGNYFDDYKLVNNELVPKKTAWKDKYTTALFSPLCSLDINRKVLQPIPDIPR